MLNVLKCVLVVHRYGIQTEQHKYYYFSLPTAGLYHKVVPLLIEINDQIVRTLLHINNSV